MAEDAEDCSPGRVPGTRAPSLSIHNPKIFCWSGGEIGAPRSAFSGLPRVLRVNQLPLPLSA